jgi:hypothetical protein
LLNINTKEKEIYIIGRRGKEDLRVALLRSISTRE